MHVVAESLATRLRADDRAEPDARDPRVAPAASSPSSARAAELRLQAVLGTIEPGPDGRPRLVQHGFRLGAEYFYPASTVKLFAAVAALERLGEIARTTGLDVGPDTPMVFHPLFAGEEREESDPTNLEGGTITVRHEIRKLFLVSDNAAFNRLYELVGQDGLAASMRRAGLREARIVHRLSEARSAEENRRYPRIDFIGAGFVHTLPERSSEPLAASPTAARVPGLEVGSAYLVDGERVEGPMDFSTKNYVPLAELQRGLCKVVRPDVDCGGGEPFAIGDADRALLLEAMSLFPRQSTNPVYDPGEYPDEYVKFLATRAATRARRPRLQDLRQERPGLRLHDRERVRRRKSGRR